MTENIFIFFNNFDKIKYIFNNIKTLGGNNLELENIKIYNNTFNSINICIITANKYNGLSLI